MFFGLFKKRTRELDLILLQCDYCEKEYLGIFEIDEENECVDCFLYYKI